MAAMMLRVVLLFAVVLLLALAGCGDSEDQSAGNGGNQVAGCLTPSEVSAEADAIAEGVEDSSDEVEQKQEAIAAVEAEAEAC
jgi:outer membrane lipoprotein-sorting protein